MKILLITTPLEGSPSIFPPLACLSIMNFLRKNGFPDVDFYNIDAKRPSYEDALKRIQAEKPDVLGISAVVATAYGFTKQITLDLKRLLPDTLIVVGGNLAANAAIILERTGTDLCVLGEGEQIMLDIVRRAQTTKLPQDFSDIPGLVLKGAKGELVNTGYAPWIPIESVYDIDWDDLVESSGTELFIYPFMKMKHGRDWWLKNDERAYEPGRQGKNVATLSVGKGCINRCSFCHRWDAGIRYIPVDLVMERLAELIRRFNVGFVDLHVENFAMNKAWLDEFCEKIKPYDVLWRTWGMRAASVTAEMVRQLKEAGCTCMVCGHETGSPKMLQIMEKNTQVQQNYDSIRWITEHGLSSVFQVCAGLPGENRKTIGETLEFLKYASTIAPWQNPQIHILSYAMAVPGTPLYEYGRRVGFIGRDMDAEEDYLLSISNPEAHLPHRLRNFTEVSDLERESWGVRVPMTMECNCIRKYGLIHYQEIIARYNKGRVLGIPQHAAKIAKDKKEVLKRVFRSFTDSNYSRYRFVPEVLHPDLAILIMLWRVKKRDGWDRAWSMLADHVAFNVKRLFGENPRKFNFPAKPLRKVVEEDIGPIATDCEAMRPLRKGR